MHEANKRGVINILTRLVSGCSVLLTREQVLGSILQKAFQAPQLGESRTARRGNVGQSRDHQPPKRMHSGVLMYGLIDILITRSKMAKHNDHRSYKSFIIVQYVMNDQILTD